MWCNSKGGPSVICICPTSRLEDEGGNIIDWGKKKEWYLRNPPLSTGSLARACYWPWRAEKKKKKRTKERRAVSTKLGSYYRTGTVFFCRRLGLKSFHRLPCSFKSRKGSLLAASECGIKLPEQVGESSGLWSLFLLGTTDR